MHNSRLHQRNKILVAKFPERNQPCTIPSQPSMCMLRDQTCFSIDITTDSLEVSPPVQKTVSPPSSHPLHLPLHHPTDRTPLHRQRISRRIRRRRRPGCTVDWLLSGLDSASRGEFTDEGISLWQSWGADVLGSPEHDEGDYDQGDES